MKFVLHDVAEEEEKMFHLCHHAKKLVTRFDKFNFLAQLFIKPFKRVPLCEMRNDGGKNHEKFN